MESIPPNWTKTKLNEVVDIIMGQSPPSNTYNSNGVGIPFYQGKAEFGDIYPHPIKYCSIPKKIAEVGDILISVRAPVGPTNLCQEKSCIGRGLAALRPNESTTIKYVFYYMRNIERWLSTQGTGSTFTAISKKDLEEIELNIAPYNEQHRIVAKVEKLLAKVDKCKERLEKIPGILKRFRQSVMAAAFNGELTRDWRLHNEPQPVSDTLQKVKRDRIKQAPNEGKKALIEAIFSYKEKEDSGDLPETWQYVSLSKICTSFKYGSSKKSKPEGDVAVLRMGNIQNGEIDWTNLVYTSDPNEIEKYTLKPDAVLFNRTNSPELVGKTAIYRGDQKAIFAGYLIQINNTQELDSEYLNYCLNTNYAKEFCNRNKTDGVSQSNINAQKLSLFEIPLCCPEEQKEIVLRIKNLFDVADRLEDRFKKAKSYCEKLTQSILSKAFKGELVDQDPNEEPASALIERIQAERKAKAPQPKNGNRSNKKPPVSTKDKKTVKDINVDEQDPGKMISTAFPKESPSKETTRKEAGKPIEKRFEKSDVLAAFRKAVFHQGDIDEYTLLRQVGQRLGVHRLSRNIRRELESFIRTAIRRKIIIRSENGYSSATPTIQHYDEDDLIKTLTSVIRKGYEHPRDHLVEEAAKYLGFEAPSDAFRERMKSVFRKAIRSGVLYRNGEYVGKP